MLCLFDKPRYERCSNEGKLLHSAGNGNWAEIERLLGLQQDMPDINCEDRYKMRPIHYAAAYGRTEVFEKLSMRDDINIENSDWNCLDLAIDNNHLDTVLCILDSKRWKWDKMLQSRSWRGKYGGGIFDTPMRKLIRRMPDAARVVLDKCVSVTIYKNTHMRLELDYRYLDDTFHLQSWRKTGTFRVTGALMSAGILEENVEENRKKVPYSHTGSIIEENHPLMTMVEYKQAELLNHPLVSGLLRRSWISIGFVFSIVDVLIYIVFLVLLTGFTLSMTALNQLNSTSFSNNSDVTNVTSSTLFSNNSDCTNNTEKSVSDFASFAKYGIIVLAAFLLLIKVLKLVYMNKLRLIKYITDFERLSELITYVTAIMFAADTNDCHDTGFRKPWQWTCGTISVFLVWIKMLFIFQNYVTFGIYVVMISRIVKMFFKFFIVYCVLLVAIAIAFHLLFRNQGNFNTFELSLVKTTSMMIGEFDFGTTFFDENLELTYFSFALLYLCLSLLIIVCINLMVALTVENIHDFLKEEGLACKTIQVKYALKMESNRNLYLWRTQKEKKSTESILSWQKKKFAKWWKMTIPDILSRINKDRSEYEEDSGILNSLQEDTDTEMTMPKTLPIDDFTNFISCAENRK